jgi:hypothetical protein
MLKENPHSAELRSNLGVMHHLLGDYPDAMRDFHAALQEQPRLFVPNLFMGLDLVQTGQPRKVICYLATPISSAPMIRILCWVWAGPIRRQAIC